MKEPFQLTASEARRQIQAGELTSERYVRSCLERIHAREPDVAAWTFLNPGQAIGQARAFDRAETPNGILGGVPVGFKDIVDTRDMPTAYGSPIYRRHQPRSDAVCVANTRRAGGIVLGKTVTTEFASRYPGPTRNPHHPAHSPGGSSSGSAAAVADEMVPLAIGTQTAGSVIRPASYCGVFGYKPGFGYLSFSGVRHLSESLDTLGCMARSIEDIALFRSALLGVDAIALRPLEQPPRIALCRTPLWHEADAATQAAVEGAARQLAAAGAPVSELELGPEFTDTLQLHHRVSRFEVRNALADEEANEYDNLSHSARESLRIGAEVGYDEYIAGLRRTDALRAAMDAHFQDIDILITPSAPGEAPLGLAFTGPIPFNYLWTLMHTPALTLPAFTGPGGLPVGLQVVARRREDDALLDAAQWVWRAING